MSPICYSTAKLFSLHNLIDLTLNLIGIGWSNIGLQKTAHRKQALIQIMANVGKMAEHLLALVTQHWQEDTAKWLTFGQC